MTRMGLVIGTDPERIEEHRRLHSAVWPDVLDRLPASGVTNDSIVLREPESLMCGYCDDVGQDCEAVIAAGLLTREWRAICGPLQRPFPARAEGDRWADMVEAFHLQ